MLKTKNAAKMTTLVSIFASKMLSKHVAGQIIGMASKLEKDAGLLPRQLVKAFCRT